MTRDEAIRIGVAALVAWHEREHGDRCVCQEGEMFGGQTAAMVDALIAEGAQFPLSSPHEEDDG